MIHSGYNITEWGCTEVSGVSTCWLYRIDNGLFIFKDIKRVEIWEYLLPEDDKAR